MMERIVGTGE